MEMFNRNFDLLKSNSGILALARIVAKNCLLRFRRSTATTYSRIMLSMEMHENAIGLKQLNYNCRQRSAVLLR